MKPVMKQIKVFADNYPFVGPALWILSIQYLIVQWIVASAWPTAYSWFNNTISDLGNTVCSPYGGRQVCSPQHALMNASFIMLGITMYLGAMLLYHEFQKSLGSIVGFSFMALAGFGTLLVGLFPENSVGSLHYLGALLAFLIGNIGVVILGLSLDVPRWFKAYSILTGLATLTALLLFYTHTYLGLGIGGMERLASYPQTIWLIVFGIYVSRDRYSTMSA